MTPRPFVPGDTVIVTILGERVKARVIRIIRARRGGRAGLPSAVIFGESPDFRRYYRFTVDHLEHA